MGEGWGYIWVGKWLIHGRKKGLDVYGEEGGDVVYIYVEYTYEVVFGVLVGRLLGKVDGAVLNKICIVDKIVTENRWEAVLISRCLFEIYNRIVCMLYSTWT